MTTVDKAMITRAANVIAVIWPGISGIVGDGEAVGFTVGIGVPVGATVGAAVGATVGAGVRVGVAALTVNAVAVEFTAAPVLSVTCILKFQVPVVVEVEVTKL